MRILLVSPPSGELTIGLKHLAKVEPLGLEIIGAAVSDHQVELLSPSTVMLYEAHRPWREMFRLPHVDLEDYAAKLSTRFRWIQFSALSTTVVRRVNT